MGKDDVTCCECNSLYECVVTSLHVSRRTINRFCICHYQKKAKLLLPVTVLVKTVAVNSSQTRYPNFLSLLMWWRNSLFSATQTSELNFLPLGSRGLAHYLRGGRAGCLISPRRSRKHVDSRKWHWLCRGTISCHLFSNRGIGALRLSMPTYTQRHPLFSKDTLADHVDAWRERKSASIWWHEH